MITNTPITIQKTHFTKTHFTPITIQTHKRIYPKKTLQTIFKTTRSQTNEHSQHSTPRIMRQYFKATQIANLNDKTKTAQPFNFFFNQNNPNNKTNNPCRIQTKPILQHQSHKQQQYSTFYTTNQLRTFKTTRHTIPTTIVTVNFI